MSMYQLNPFYSEVVSRNNPKRNSNQPTNQQATTCHRKKNNHLKLTLDHTKQAYIDNSSHSCIFNNERIIREEIANKLTRSDDGKIIIEEDLDVSNSTYLRALPNELEEINGNLNVFNCRYLQFPKKLTVHGNLNIRNAHITLGDLTVYKNVIVEKAENTVFMQKMSKQKRITIKGAVISEALIKHEFIRLSKTEEEKQLRALINAKLKLTGICELEMQNLSLPENKLSALRALPKELMRVIGPLNLPKSNINSLPPNLIEVTSNVNLENCSRLTSLSPNLNVHGSINLKNCTNLINLPAGLRFTGTLNLKGCKKLRAIPNEIMNQGQIIMPDHLALHKLC
ncbi:hypothetical protein DID76_04370 [Candidatus Marinamargulisbacteria bacterium SCGC AG-414-C22]|nr:hypothetical protein DID76_04370 [Candidatus Marinamargulisbacteria bacterium SCGC AG-414-C22]